MSPPRTRPVLHSHALWGRRVRSDHPTTPQPKGRSVDEPLNNLTDTEYAIAMRLQNGLDMIARLIAGGGVSKEYFASKFGKAVEDFEEVVKLTGIDPYNHTSNDAERSWRFEDVWDAAVARGMHMAPALRQVWTALQYDNPYFSAEYPLSDNTPYFPERPMTLDDPKSQDWHVQYALPDRQPPFVDTVVRGRSASDAVRNTYYLYPQATHVRLNTLEHEDLDGLH